MAVGPVRLVGRMLASHGCIPRLTDAKDRGSLSRSPAHRRHWQDAALGASPTPLAILPDAAVFISVSDVGTEELPV